jgi:hypothetical protein
MLDFSLMYLDGTSVKCIPEGKGLIARTVYYAYVH